MKMKNKKTKQVAEMQEQPKVEAAPVQNVIVDKSKDKSVVDKATNELLQSLQNAEDKFAATMEARIKAGSTVARLFAIKKQLHEITRMIQKYVPCNN